MEPFVMEDTVREVLEEYARLAFLASVVVLIGLIIVFGILSSLETSCWQQLAKGLLPNLLAALIVYQASYLVFRRIQHIRQEHGARPQTSAEETSSSRTEEAEQRAVYEILYKLIMAAPKNTIDHNEVKFLCDKQFINELHYRQLGQILQRNDPS
jgi:hypothetical protein